VSRRTLVLLALGATVVTATDVTSFYVNAWPGPAGRPIYLISPLLVLVAFLLVGILAWRSYPDEGTGRLFTLTGYAWFLPLLLQIHAGVPFTIANVTNSVYQATLTHLALAWPYGRLRSRIDRVVVGVNYGWNLLNPLLSNMFWDPQTQGCEQRCPNNLVLVHDSHHAYDAINTASAWIGAAITVVVIARFAQNWLAADGYERRAMTRLLVVALPIAAYIELLNFQDDLGWPFVVLNEYGPLILLAAPGAYAVARLWTRRARTAVGAAIVDLEPGSPPERLRGALARALGDPLLQLGVRRADGLILDTSDRVIDLSDLPPGRGAVELDGEGSAVMVFDADLSREPALLRVATSAASLALEHARLQAAVEAQLEQVRASRARIVEAGDAERRRLERDLHDGAQQRLVTLSLVLGAASRRASDTDRELSDLIESARTEAREALVELRELARGIHPAVLTEAGLRGAIQALVERSLVATSITGLPEQRLPAAVEATAYFVVSEALANVAKHADGATATVSASVEDDLLTVRVVDDGPGGADATFGSGLRGLADRVASVGGSLRVDSPVGGGTCVEARVPTVGHT
jgi:signal transduction histidine kinase